MFGTPINNYKYYEMLDGTSERAKQLHALLKKDQSMKNSAPLVVELVDKMKANAKEFLSLPVYKEFAVEVTTLPRITHNEIKPWTGCSIQRL